MTVQKTRVGHVDQASQITVEPVNSVTKTNVQSALEQLTSLVTPNDAEFVTGASNVALPNALVLTDTATVTWDLSTPNQAKANAASAANTFSTIAVSGQSNVVADSTSDTLTLVAGTNVTITTDATTDSVTIAASGGGGGNTFSTIAVSGQSDVVADSSSDTLTLAAGSNITITTNAGTDTVTIAASGGTGDALTSGTLAQFAATTSAQLKGVISDETGVAGGLLVFSLSPTLTTPTLDYPTLKHEILITSPSGPTQITSDQNDYTADGTLSDAAVFRITTDSNSGAGRAITGFANSTAGKFLIVANAGSNPLTLKDENASSTAAYRMALNGDIVLLADDAAMLWYDGTTGRWRMVARAIGATAKFEALTFAAGTTSVAPITLTSGTNLTTAAAGNVEYDGVTGMFTPLGTQRGVLQSAQLFRLNANLVGSNATGNQAIFGKSVTVSGSTVYAFRLVFTLSKAAGTTSHTITVGVLGGGSATVNNAIQMYYSNLVGGGTGAVTNVARIVAASLNNTTVTGGITAAATAFAFHIEGTVSINAGGTLQPIYALSAAPGGAYSTLAGSYMEIWPIGASGADVNVGTWA